MSVGFYNFKMQVAVVKAVADFRYFVCVFHNPAVERGHIGVLVVDFEIFKYIIKVCHTVNNAGCVVNFFNVNLNLVVLVPNFAYKFFNYILKCYNALCTAEFVNNNGKMGFVLLEYSQKFADFCIGADGRNSLDDCAQRFQSTASDVLKITVVNDAHNVVDVADINRQSAVSA